LADQLISDGAIRDLVTTVAVEKFNRDAMELDYAIRRYVTVHRSGRRMDKKL
jgi:hypothetical protein